MRRSAPFPFLSAVVCSLGLFSAAAAQTSVPAYRPVLLAGCALPEGKYIAVPLDVELRLAVDSSGAVLGVEVSKGSGRPEVDAAFASAAGACRFAPVPQAGLDGRNGAEHKLAYRYDGGPPPLGMHGCFATEYPRGAQLREEEGSNSISFRLPAGDAQPQVRLSRSSGSASLDAEALLRASRCLSNAGVRAALVPDQWYQQTMVWVLQ